MHSQIFVLTKLLVIISSIILMFTKISSHNQSYFYTVYIKQDFLDSFTPMVFMGLLNEEVEEVDNNFAEEDKKLQQVATLLEMPQSTVMELVVNKQHTMTLELLITMPPLQMPLKQLTMEMPLPIQLLLN